MTDDSKYNLFIISYEGQDTADEAYHTLHDLQKEKKIKIKTAAVVTRKDNGKLKLKHKRRLTVWKGVFGGGAVGLLLAGTGVGALAGAVIGALIGSSRHKDRQEVKAFLDDKLGQNDSALAILVKDADWEAVQAAIASYGGEELMVELTPEAEAQLNELAGDEKVAEAVNEEVEVEDDPEVEEVPAEASS